MVKRLVYYEWWRIPVDAKCTVCDQTPEQHPTSDGIHACRGCFNPQKYPQMEKVA